MEFQQKNGRLICVGNAYVSGMKEDVRLPSRARSLRSLLIYTAQTVRQPAQLFDNVLQHWYHCWHNSMSNASTQVHSTFDLDPHM